MNDRKTPAREAVEMDEVRLLQTDPDRFFESRKRIPFGFVLSSRTKDTSTGKR